MAGKLEIALGSESSENSGTPDEFEIELDSKSSEDSDTTPTPDETLEKRASPLHLRAALLVMTGGILLASYAPLVIRLIELYRFKNEVTDYDYQNISADMMGETLETFMENLVRASLIAGGGSMVSIVTAFIAGTVGNSRGAEETDVDPDVHPHNREDIRGDSTSWWRYATNNISSLKKSVGCIFWEQSPEREGYQPVPTSPHRHDH